MFAITKPENFFEYYHADFWLNKASVLSDVIEKEEKEQMEKGTAAVDQQTLVILQDLKMEVHFTYYQALETLFSLITAFRRKRIDNRGLWHYLVQLSKPKYAKFVYETVAETAEGKTSYLDCLVTVGEKLEVPFSQYLLYFGVPMGLEADDASKNLKSITEILVRLATDFADRESYNAYKHGLRLYCQGESKLQIIPHEEPKQVISFDMKPAIVILKKDADGTIKQTAKCFDYRLDFDLIKLGSALIHNIIVSRRRFYSNEKSVNLYFFDKFDVSMIPTVNSEILDWTVYLRNETAKE